MLTIFKMIYAFSIVLAAGRLIFEIPILRLKDEKLGIRLPLYFMSGSVILSLYMFLLFFLKVEYSVLAISAPFLIYLAYYSFNNLKYLPAEVKNTVSYSKALYMECRDRSNLIFMSALMSLILILIVVFLENFIIPVYIGDVYCMWFFKAKAIFMSKTIPFDLFTDINYWFVSPTYPLLASLNVAWVATCLGHWSDTITKTFYSLQYLAMIIFFYASLKRLVKSKMAMVGTFITFTIPHIIGDITTGYVDLIVAFYGCMAIILIFNWMNDNSKKGYFFLSALFIGAGAWAHNEGLMLFAAMILTLIVYFIGQLIAKKVWIRDALIKLLFYFIVYWLVTAPFKALITSYKLKQLWVSNIWQLFSFAQNLYRVPTITGYFLYELFLNTYLWLYFWIFLFIIIFINRRNIMDTNIKYVLLFVFFSIAMVFEVFLVSMVGESIDSVVGLIRLNLDRAMLIFTPAAGFLLFSSAYDPREH